MDGCIARCIAGSVWQRGQASAWQCYGEVISHAYLGPYDIVMMYNSQVCMKLGIPYIVNFLSVLVFTCVVRVCVKFDCHGVDARV